MASRPFFLFFFQAEDGIRDYKLTGVQTCALPIYRPTRGQLIEIARRDRAETDPVRALDSGLKVGPRGTGPSALESVDATTDLHRMGLRAISRTVQPCENEAGFEVNP